MTAPTTPRRLTLAGAPLPLVGRARAYVCGITPYDTTHLGHAATFVWADVATRILRRGGVEVVSCRNVTDVDDVLDAAADRAGVRFDSFAAVGQFRFDRDMAALGVRPPAHEPRAHNHVDAVVALAAGLLERGVAYERDGTVLARAGALGLDVLDAPGPDASRETVGEGVADDPGDVLVWRRAEPGEAAWPSPWGEGRPGWHAECAAMALSVLGASVDLQIGGADLAHPHHTHQAALAEALTGVRPFARARLHVGLVRLGGTKMAKSAGNLVLVSDLVERAPAAAVRLMLLDRPWSADQDLGADADRALDAAAARLERLYGAAGRREAEGAGAEAVLDRLFDDLDVPGALAVAEREGGDAARTALAVLGLT